MLRSGTDTLGHELGDSVAESVAPPPVRSRHAALILATLTLIYALNYLDRQIVVILQEPIKRDYRLHDWQLGLLTGASISILYTACGLPIARRVDRGLNRVGLIAAITALWSVMTMICGVTRTFGQFIAARMGVGLAESGLAPAAHSLLSDLFPLRRRPMAMGIFALGIPVGIMLGMSAGGLIAQRYDWRTALLVVGLPGLAVSLLFRLFAREPLRGAAEAGPIAGDATPITSGAAFRLLARRPAYVQLVLGSAAASFSSTAIFSWMPSFLIRAHGMSLVQAGLGVGLLAGVSGLFGTVSGGWLAMRTGRHGLAAMLRAPVAGLLLSIPLFVSALLVGSGSATLLLLLPALVLTGFWTAPMMALTQTLAPLAARATASAVHIVAANLLGVALGPIVIGLLSDAFTRALGSPGDGLRWALVCAAGLLTWGSTHFLLAMRALHREAAAGRVDA